MAKIFINYRREDSQYQADRLRDLMKPWVDNPATDIFIDVDNIPAGVDFVEHLDGKVRQCDALIVMIGEHWLTMSDPHTGGRRLDNSDDFVRIEIESALNRNIPVVPVLLDNVDMPSVHDLPDSLKPLARRNGVKISRLSFENDVNRLMRSLPLELSAPRASRGMHKGLVSSFAAIFVFGGLGVATWVFDPLEWRSDVSPNDIEVPSAVEEQIDASGNGVETNSAATGVIDAISSPVPANAADDAAWARAKQSATVAAYRAYLGNDENTEHRAEAQVAVNRHEQAVMRLQTALAAKEIDPGGTDGTVGSRTRAAVESYRRARQYSVGSIDLSSIDTGPISEMAASAETWAKPKAAVSPPSRIPVTTSPDPTSIAYSAGQTFRDNLSGGGSGPEMVVVPAGTFRMGSPNSETGRDQDEGPLRTIRIGAAFAVGKYEVTWAEWNACVSDGGCSNAGPDSKGGDEGWGLGKRPVINVDWNDAKAYAAWLSRKTGETYRLLSEAEWEYAARAGTTTPFSFGQTITPSQANYDGNYTYGSGPKGTYREKTMPVGSYPANAFGLHDLHGNVWEWTQDCWNGSYAGAPTNGAAWESGDCSRRVVRGGSWFSIPQYLRSASRNRDDTSNRYIDIGFRVARTL